MLNYFGRNTSNIQGKHWDSIDELPLYNWIKCVEEHDYRYVCKDINDVKGVNVADAWNKIFDDYINRYGLSKLYLRLLKVMKEKAILECDYVLTKDKFKLTLIEIEEINLSKMMSNKGENKSINSVLVYLSKWLGYRVNTKEVTTLEYFEMIDLYGKENSKVRDSRR